MGKGSERIVELGLGVVPPLRQCVALLATLGFNFEVATGSKDGSWRYQDDTHGMLAYVTVHHFARMRVALDHLKKAGIAHALLDNRLEILCTVEG